MFKGCYLFQTIILGIHVSFRECTLPETNSEFTLKIGRLGDDSFFFGKAYLCLHERAWIELRPRKPTAKNLKNGPLEKRRTFDPNHQFLGFQSLVFGGVWRPYEIVRKRYNYCSRMEWEAPKTHICVVRQGMLMMLICDLWNCWVGVLVYTTHHNTWVERLVR